MSTSPLIEWNTEDLQLFLPFKLNEQITLLACWTKGKDIQAFKYIGHFWKYLQIHRTSLAKKNTIILGDLNSNAKFDSKREDCWWNHTSVMEELSVIGISSLYHHLTGEQQGRETSPTYYHYRNQSKPYHLDYVFMSNSLLQSAKLDIGSKAEWLKLSDHLPLSVII